jgi:DNA-binding SARP family transcriptional activator/Tol biopolymer transport system component
MTLFRILGPLEVDVGGDTIPLGGPKQRAVLAHLVLRANQLVPAETLIDQIWPEEPPEKVRNVIQTYVSHLRKALGHDRIESHGPGYRLRLDPAELDAVRFDALMRDAKKSLPVDPNVAVATLEDALALWRGPALADLADQSSLLAEAARLDELRLEAQETRIEGLLAAGIQAQAIGELEALIARHPWRESLWGLLMLAFYREGRQAEALRSYQRVREILADELGIDPSPELVRLHQRVLKQDPGLDLRGEPLRGYRLLEKIDAGPRGAVFRALQPRVERDVAVKIFHEAIAADPEFVRRFDADAQAVAALEHPHIAPIYDYWREPSRAYVVSRYLRGGSLRAIEERGEPLDRERALRAVEQISLALTFAHRQGLAHGNVGPSNIVFDPEGNAYLGDFQIGSSPAPDAAEDVRELARLASRLLPTETAFAELAQRVEVATDAPPADAWAQACRTALEPTAIVAPRRIEERNPYKGLRPFTEADARDFFGREGLIRRLVARLGEAEPGSRFLAVVGASGSGKSSVVRAGLVPAIRDGALGRPEDPFVAEMFPGEHPIDELEAALLRIAVHPVPRLRERLDSGSRGLLEVVDLVAPGEAEVVVVVDQFEEAFTLTTDERERELFLESLRVAAADPESRLRVIVTLRADFYDRPLVYPRFGELLAEGTEAVPPLTPDELERAIRGPAERIGVRPEPGLLADMIADVAHQPGALPLLQYALTELFEHRDEDRLTLAAYRQIGGIAGALSARADRIYESTEPHGRRATKQVFLRLVALGEGRQDTRRRVPRGELDALDVDQEAIERAVNTFAGHRLLTFDREPSTREPTVEIAHEALLSAWERLRTWIDDAREDLRQERGLARAAAEWRGSGGDPSFLLRGARLEQLESWAATTDLAIGRPERAYLKASVDQHDREQEEEEQRREREVRIERRSARRLRGLVAVFAAAALLAGTLTVVATNQRSRAEREAGVARARELAAAAVSTGRLGSLAYGVDGDIYVAEWDGSNPVRIADGRPPKECVLGWPGEYWGEGPIWSPDGRYLAYRHTNCDGPEDAWRHVVISDPQGNVIAEFPGDGWDISWSPDSTRVAVWATVFEAIGVFGVDGERQALLTMPPGWRPAGDHDPVWLPDGKSLVLQGVVIPIDGSTPYKLPSARGTPSPDGSHVAHASRKSLVIAGVDGSNPQVVFDDGVWNPVWSPTGDRIAFTTWKRGSGGVNHLRVLDAATGTVTLLAEAGGSDQLEVIDFSPESDRILFARMEGRIGAGSLWSVNADGSDAPRRLVAVTSWGDWLSPGSTP